MSVVEFDDSIPNIGYRECGLVASIYIIARKKSYKSDCKDGLLFPNTSAIAGISKYRSGDSLSAHYQPLESHAGHILPETEDM